MHIYHVASGTPVAAILRPSRQRGADRRGAVPVRHSASYRQAIGRGAVCPDEPPTWQINPERGASRVASHRSRRTERRHALARAKKCRVMHDPG